MPNYSFGATVINQNSAGLGLFLLEKSLDLPQVAPISFSIARRDGVKKSGESVKERTITVLLKVVGSSRTDLMSRLDSLMQALSLRSQSLVIHEDGRLFQSVDAVAAPIKFSAGNGIVECSVAVSFIAYDPYAYAASPSTYDTGTVALTASGGSWVFPAINITGGGTIYSLPLLRLTNKTSTGSTTLTAARNSGTNYTTIAVAATSFSGSIGDTITITHGGTTQTLTVATAFSVGATTITVSSFTASANYVSSDVAAKVTQWSSITITQTTDNLTLTGSTSVAAPFPLNNSDYLDIQCDPAATNGWTIQPNSLGVFAEPVGLFAVMEPGTTTFNISIVSGSAVSAECVFTWTPRYAS